jgi:hypothetical protein
MPPLTPAQVSIGNAAAVENVLITLQTLIAQVDAIVSANSTTPFANAWANLNTTALASDGRLGTPDATPVQTDPVDTRVYPQLPVALSYLQLTQALGVVVTDLNNFLGGEAVSSNGLRPALLAAVASSPVS